MIHDVILAFTQQIIGALSSSFIVPLLVLIVAFLTFHITRSSTSLISILPTAVGDGEGYNFQFFIRNTTHPANITLRAELEYYEDAEWKNLKDLKKADNSPALDSHHLYPQRPGTSRENFLPWRVELTPQDFTIFSSKPFPRHRIVEFRNTGGGGESETISLDDLDDVDMDVFTVPKDATRLRLLIEQTAEIYVFDKSSSDEWRLLWKEIGEYIPENETSEGKSAVVRNRWNIRKPDRILYNVLYLLLTPLLFPQSILPRLNWIFESRGISKGIHGIKKYITDLPNRFRETPSVFLFIGLLSVLYLIEIITVGNFSTIEEFRYWFVMQSVYPTTPGWFLSIISHGSIAHLFTSLATILALGIGMERHLGSRLFLGFIILTGYGANVSQAAFRAVTQSEIAVGGASGIGFAMMAFYPLIHYSEKSDRSPRKSLARLRKKTATKKDEIDLILAFILLVAFLFPVLQIAGLSILEKSAGVGHFAGASLGLLAYLVDTRW